MSTNSRPYIHPDDLARILDFIRIVRPPERLCDYPGLIDIEELLADPEIQANTRLWLHPVEGPVGGPVESHASELVAYAILNSYDALQFDILPAQLETTGPGILEWAAERAREKKSDRIYANCIEGNLTRQNFLESHGFEIQPDDTLHYERSLLEPIPAPVLPAGFSIRPLRGEAEAKAAAEMHRAAFGTDYMTTTNRLAMMHSSGYDPQMDLMAVAPDGRLAAYTMGSIRAEENARTGRKDGYSDPVATHPDFQRLGLARALLFTSMQMLAARGMDTIKLGTSSDNTAMQKAAEAAGFSIASRTRWYRKSVG